VNWNLSHSSYSTLLSPFFETFDPEYPDILSKIKEILNKEDELSEIIQIVGRDSLADPDKLAIETARLIREDFLQQNIFTSYDSPCPIYKATWMMKNISTFYSLSLQALEQDVSWAKIKRSAEKVIIELTRMKFQDPHDGRDVVEQYMRDLNRNIFRTFSVVNE